jgi:hypothetical protein
MPLQANNECRLKSDKEIQASITPFGDEKISDYSTQFDNVYDSGQVEVIGTENLLNTVVTSNDACDSDQVEVIGVEKHSM